MITIINYWAEQDPSWLKSYYIGWGEPFCFACGWLPPVRDGRLRAWEIAAKWLDRAHLQDRFFGGPDKPHNLVPLCHLCHDKMPDSQTYAFGVDWVKSRPDREMWFQMFTDDLLHGVTATRSTTLMRARMHYLEILRSASVVTDAS